MEKQGEPLEFERVARIMSYASRRDWTWKHARSACATLHFEGDEVEAEQCILACAEYARQQGMVPWIKLVPKNGGRLSGG
jgi:hypothetical protein